MRRAKNAGCMTASSIGLKSGEYGGKNSTRIPLLVIRSDLSWCADIKVLFFNHLNDCLVFVYAAVVHDDYRVRSRVWVHEVEESIYKLRKVCSIEGPFNDDKAKYSIKK